jgi:UrcA family protein
MVASMLAGSAGAALGADRAIAVPYADLDLADAAGAAILYHRIEVAAARLCGPREVGGPDVDSLAYHRCVVAAIGRAVREVDRPALSAYHRTHVRR